MFSLLAGLLKMMSISVLLHIVVCRHSRHRCQRDGSKPNDVRIVSESTSESKRSGSNGAGDHTADKKVAC